ncbi:MAG: hypothetical protein LH631_08475 [Alkalinema sp. CAN_BIN05]|nr:hypothetical protein [Alkalinema sp. CAN_BIN05]
MTIEQIFSGLLILTIGPIVGTIKPLWRDKTSLAIAQGLLCVGVSKLLFSYLLHPQFLATGSSEWTIAWDMIALMGLVLARSFRGDRVDLWSIGAGYGLHDPISAGLAALLSGTGVICFRTNKQGLRVVLFAMMLVTALRYSANQPLLVMTGLLCTLIYWSYEKTDRSKPSEKTNPSETGLKFFRADAAVVTLDDRMLPLQSGQPAAYLSQLRRSGYSVPQGWLVYPGDDLETVIALATPTAQFPAIVRYSHLLANPLDDRTKQVWESKSDQELRSALLQAFDGAKASMVLMVMPKVWAVFSGAVREVMPGYVLVTCGQERFEVRSKGQISANVKTYETPDRLIREVAELLSRLQKEFGEDYKKQLGGGFAIDWMHDGERVWIWDIRGL